MAFFFLILFFVLAFLSNRTLLFLFKDKIRTHKTNSIEKLQDASILFSGVELDVVYSPDEKNFEINHPPDPSTGLFITEYFQAQKNNPGIKYWLDFKNLGKGNDLQSCSVLDSITKLYNISKSSIIVESMYPQSLIEFQKNGFLTSYYLPIGMHLLDKDSLAILVEKIKKDIALYDNLYISSEYKDYPILKKQFPEKKKLFWFTVYGSMNKIRARLLLFELLSDENVDVLLIPFPF